MFPIVAALPVIGKVIDGITGVIDKAVEDKDLAAKLKQELNMQAMQGEFSFIETEIRERARIITAEAEGQSVLQRNWRPILMLVIVAIVANNYIVFPYLSLFTAKTIMLELPERLWALMEIGVGGYVVGRTAEKCVETWRKPS
jgi:hypothetical protein